MRRTILIVLAVAGVLAATGWAARGAVTEPARLAPAPAAHQHAAAATSGGATKGLATQLARARQATARYATNLKAAKAIVTWEQVPEVLQIVLADAQTSGGLLLCVPPRRLETVRKVLQDRQDLPVRKEVLGSKDLPAHKA